MHDFHLLKSFLGIHAFLYKTTSGAQDGQIFLIPHTPYKKAAGIQLAERDFQLDLNCELWPAETHPRPKGWQASKAQPWLSRIIDSGEPTDEETPESSKLDPEVLVGRRPR